MEVFILQPLLNLCVWISCSINQKQKPKSGLAVLITDAFQCCPLCPFLSKQGEGASSRFMFVCFSCPSNNKKLLVCIPLFLSLCCHQVNPFHFLLVKSPHVLFPHKNWLLSTFSSHTHSFHPYESTELFHRSAVLRSGLVSNVITAHVLEDRAMFLMFRLLS